MAILVTGGAGFIGSHTCIELLNEGYEIIVVDNFSNSKPESLNRVCEITGKSIMIYHLNLLDLESLEKVFLVNQIEAVIHFAGLKAVGESIKDSLKYYKNNITTTIIICELMQKYNVKKLVFSSSATVYGLPDTVPITEGSPVQAINPYGRTKLMIEEILQDLYISDNEWSITILRYFNPIGAHESGLIGEDPSGIPNNLMPYITKVAVGQLKELQIFGKSYSTVDGTGVRDYIHVVDLAIGHVLALDKTLKTSGVKIYNLGTGKGYSVLEVVSAFEAATGVKIPFKITQPRTGDAAICYANPSKAEKELNWIAKKSIQDMCEDSWRWQSRNPNGYTKNEELENPRLIRSEVFLMPKN
ncbi:UDP-glucose 4-epimerase GalE [Peribacillus sp. NPDC097895]|uniref:UDP-glucose 4-epimerase GalE n=1 Tax=Peribacillus sp. NPDC097895 TaxID=3390619 RepID=UPI003D017CA4